jgi:mercuric ion binding protein
MKLHTSVLALIGFMAAAPVFAAEQTLTFSVPGMTCASCPFIAEAAMGSVDGVVTVTADAETRTALVVFDDAITTIDAISLASVSAGYDASTVSAELGKADYKTRSRGAQPYTARTQAVNPLYVQQLVYRVVNFVRWVEMGGWQCSF